MSSARKSVFLSLLMQLLKLHGLLNGREKQMAALIPSLNNDAGVRTSTLTCGAANILLGIGTYIPSQPQER